MRALLTSIALCLVGTATLAQDWTVKDSPMDVTATADRLEQIIGGTPATMTARVDHQAAARDADLTMGAATVLIFGNPALGTPLMQANPMVAMDLPMRILVWDDAGQTKIGYLPPDALAARYDITGLDYTVAQMTAALDKITDTAIAE